MKNSGSGPKYEVSPRPVDFRYFSALAAMVRGSREYGWRVTASMMSQHNDRVGSSMNGSIMADSGSGRKIMSDALIGCHPRIELPSKKKPSLNDSSFSLATGIVVCCQIPS